MMSRRMRLAGYVKEEDNGSSRLCHASRLCHGLGCYTVEANARAVRDVHLPVSPSLTTLITTIKIEIKMVATGTAREERFECKRGLEYLQRLRGSRFVGVSAGMR